MNIIVKDELISFVDLTWIFLNRELFVRKNRFTYHWIDYKNISNLPIQLVKLFTKILEIAPQTDNIRGLEFWTTILQSGELIDWHTDKDEAAFWGRSDILHPAYSVITYLHPHPIDGGELEVESCGLYPAIPLRTIIIPGNSLHQVLRVKTGLRVSIVINIWNIVPLAYHQ